MASYRYALKVGGPGRIEVSWYRGITDDSDIIVKLDGRVIGTFTNRAEFEAGKEFGLANGARVRVKQGMTYPAVYWNDLQLPLASRGPLFWVRTASLTMLAIGLLSFFVVLAIAAPIKDTMRALLDPRAAWLWALLALGVLCLVLAWFIHRRSLIAALMAILVISVLSIGRVVLFAVSERSSLDLIFPVLVACILVNNLVRGYLAIRLIKRHEEADLLPPPVSLAESILTEAGEPRATLGGGGPDSEGHQSKRSDLPQPDFASQPAVFPGKNWVRAAWITALLVGGIHLSIVFPIIRNEHFSALLERRFFIETLQGLFGFVSIILAALIFHRSLLAAGVAAYLFPVAMLAYLFRWEVVNGIDLSMVWQVGIWALIVNIMIRGYRVLRRIDSEQFARTSLAVDYSMPRQSSADVPERAPWTLPSSSEAVQNPDATGRQG